VTVPELRAALAGRLRRLRGIVVSESMFGNGDAYWCNGTEIAHFENDAVIEVRLTKAVIRDRRAALQADPRVVLRPGGADWMTVLLTSEADVAFVVALVRSAVAIHRPATSERPKPPPTGVELRRRQRFH